MSAAAGLAIDLDAPGSGGARVGVTSAPSRSMLARVHLAYLWRYRRSLDLRNPRRFTELVQWRKLYDRDPQLPSLIDKVNVKRVVAQHARICRISNIGAKALPAASAS